LFFRNIYLTRLCCQTELALRTYLVLLAKNIHISIPEKIIARARTRTYITWLLVFSTSLRFFSSSRIRRVRHVSGVRSVSFFLPRSKGNRRRRNINIDTTSERLHVRSDHWQGYDERRILVLSDAVICVLSFGVYVHRNHIIDYRWQ